MKKVRAHYKGKYYYLGRAKNEDIELFRRNFIINNKTVKFIRNV